MEWNGFGVGVGEGEGVGVFWHVRGRFGWVLGMFFSGGMGGLGERRKGKSMRWDGMG